MESVDIVGWEKNSGIRRRVWRWQICKILSLNIYWENYRKVWHNFLISCVFSIGRPSFPTAIMTIALSANQFSTHKCLVKRRGGWRRTWTLWEWMIYLLLRNPCHQTFFLYCEQSKEFFIWLQSLHPCYCCYIHPLLLLACLIWCLIKISVDYWGPL
jgi:hypothetical protein